MVLYGRPDFSIGKDVPAMGPWKNYRPAIVGPHSSKIKVGIYIGYKLGRFLLGRPWVKGALSGAAIGTGIGLIGEISQDVGTTGDHQTYAQYRKRSSVKRNNKKYRSRRSTTSAKHCCC